MKEIVKFIYFFLIYRIFFIFPMKKNRIVFSSYYGKNYSCNPRMICEYMIKENLNYEIIYVLNQNNQNNQNIKFVKRGSLKYLFYFATSKYRISNCQESYYLKPRKGMIYLQTWHGIPLKKIAQDINGKEFDKIKKEWKIEANYWDYLIVSNEELNQLFKKAFGIEKCKIINCNYPRNEIFKESSRIPKIKRELENYGLNKNKKIILYAPTFRDGEEIFKLNLSKKFIEEVTENYNFLFRAHSNIKNSILHEKIIDVSKYDDINELYLIADILITDYSSVFFDFALLEKPMIFYPYDIIKYENILRGFYYPYNATVPGPIVFNEEELLSEILKVEKNFDKEKIKKFNKKFNSNFNVNSIEKILKEIGIK